MELTDAFRTQAVACGSLGSPMYAELLDRMAAELSSGVPSVLSEVLAGHESDPGPSALALRLAGSLHRLVLAGQAPALAAFYPSVGGTWDLAAAWPVVVSTVAEHHEAVHTLLGQPPQTNEVGRSAALVGALRRLDARLPVRLFELGASGGLNLLADHYDFSGDAATGVGQPPTIVERLGCDVAPVDAATDQGALTLTSYCWPDQAARLERLRAALALAREHPVEVRRQDAASFVEGIELAPGHLAVVWHSVMWQYVPHDQQERITARLGALGAAATTDAPLAHVYAEPLRRTPESEHEFLICVEQWPGDGVRRVVGTMAPHGLPTTWEA